MKVSEFDYDLPRELIAQTPTDKRDHSRLMIVSRKTGEIKHDYFYNLPKYLRADDLVVLNKTKVFPARLFGKKETGGKVEVLLLRPGWEYISKPGLKEGMRIMFDQNLEAIIENGLLKFSIESDDLMDKLNDIGYTPLPPYITAPDESAKANIRRRYQTVYAAEIGSAAAPTAGLHFTQELLGKVPNKEYVTLHVGLGTFAPVKTEDVEEHKMHSEYFSIPQTTIHKLQVAKRIVAVGTTTVRTLETWANTGKLSGETDIFIYPGYKFKVVNAMITNFHLPKSTLMMLVSAFAEKDLIMKAYQEAVREKYRFFSFGDAMVII